MTTDQNPDRPEVDDPRVLALAKARQQRAHQNPFNAGFCPPWDGLTGQEQHLSQLDARNYLRAAIDAGLIPVPSAAAPPAQADVPCAVCQRVNDGSHPAVCFPPAPVDRAAVLEEAAQAADRLSMQVEQDLKRREVGPLTALQDLADELRRLAEAPQPETEATPVAAPRITADGDGVLVHLPEITYLDTQVWAADIGLTRDALRAFRDAATAHLAAASSVVAQPETEAAETPDTLPAWLYQRFMPDGVGWENLDADDRSYWEHQARAVRRAVARGGFRETAAPAVVAQPGKEG